MLWSKECCELEGVVEWSVLCDGLKFSQPPAAPRKRGLRAKIEHAMGCRGISNAVRTKWV